MPWTPILLNRNLRRTWGSRRGQPQSASGTRMTAKAEDLLTPQIDGHTKLSVPSFSFLVEHPSGRTVVFDLGLRKDFDSLPPAVQAFLKDCGWKLEVTKNVSDILEDGGIPLSGIEAVIWSHHHFDHVGDMTAFPRTADLVVGPSFKEHYMPAWPTDPGSTLDESAWDGRNVREISFDEDCPKIGSFDAFDYFGDGSYYILHCPGHTFGHIAALARVTVSSSDSAEDTFVLMGGDTCHFAGQFRPTRYKPLPREVEPSPLQRVYPDACPGALFRAMHPTRSASTPFYEMPRSCAVDVEAAHQSIRYLQQFDAAVNVLVVIAHDESLLGEIDFFPDSINQWKANGCGEKARWQFLRCFRTNSSALHLKKSYSFHFKGKAEFYSGDKDTGLY
ncbi:predicted protein [Uncinocarpus reesii 1704]|uniref:Metallo-beta-lactamase domain-containing protein n=1 Tax=Uncinocarpus reesii (strain UAMH 1704) TaxID=336963 RepID=C4JXS2_UNCRE|nr:uncharacterized protein UREG_07860 [Uncinocarpus reesii 1704]EEP82995.1 predicted protein [Uncinocarpus reesii 1704]